MTLIGGSNLSRNYSINDFVSIKYRHFINAFSIAHFRPYLDNYLKRESGEIVSVRRRLHKEGGLLFLG